MRLVSRSSSVLLRLVVPAVAATVVFAVLVALGSWQLERRSWKEGLLRQIETRAHGLAEAPIPEGDWAGWSAADDEFRRVRIRGRWQADAIVPVIGLAEERPGRALQGVYVYQPLRRDDGSSVIVNRGFVPVEARAETIDRLRREGSEMVELTGLVRAPEKGGMFLPSNDPRGGTWFVRDLGQMAAANGLTRVAPFFVDADRAAAGPAWPRGGNTPLKLRNNHLEYAWTWFGLAGALLAVFAGLVVSRLRGPSRGGQTVS